MLEIFEQVDNFYTVKLRIAVEIQMGQKNVSKKNITISPCYLQLFF